MKKLLVLLFSLFFLSSPSVFADDISDFSIEGISIGDSLLDYMSEDEILEEIEKTKNLYLYLKEPHKYAEIYSLKPLSPIYENYSFLVKNTVRSKYITNENENENEKFIILSVRGINSYIEDFDGCINKRNEIVLELSSMFPHAEKFEYTYSHSADPSGNSIRDDVYFEFNSGGAIDVICSDWEETFRGKMNYSEGLSVAIRSNEIMTWLEQ